MRARQVDLTNVCFPKKLAKHLKKNPRVGHVVFDDEDDNDEEKEDEEVEDEEEDEDSDEDVDEEEEEEEEEEDGGEKK